MSKYIERGYTLIVAGVELFVGALLGLLLPAAWLPVYLLALSVLLIVGVLLILVFGVIDDRVDLAGDVAVRRVRFDDGERALDCHDGMPLSLRPQSLRPELSGNVPV